MILKIPLGSDKVTLIDECDFETIKNFSWGYLKTKNKEYATTNVDKKTLYLHHFILSMKDGFEIDHVDGDGLNNTRKNLRYVTHAQNQANQKLSVANTTGYKGVIQDKRAGVKAGWYAQSKKKGQRVYLGRWVTPEEAAISYDNYMRETYGEFAATNESLGILKRS